MQLILTPPPPFDFDLSASIFSEGDQEIRKYENGKFWQVVRLNGELCLLIVKSTGTVDGPKLQVEAKSKTRIPQADKKLEHITSTLFNLGLDLKPFL